ncbi:unnamed protein product [Gordionus sp. m RMFG-2023]
MIEITLPSSSDSEEDEVQSSVSRMRTSVAQEAPAKPYHTPYQKIAKVMRVWKGLKSDLKESKCKANDRDSHEIKHACIVKYMNLRCVNRPSTDHYHVYTIIFLGGGCSTRSSLLSKRSIGNDFNILHPCTFSRKTYHWLEQLPN